MKRIVLLTFILLISVYGYAQSHSGDAELNAALKVISAPCLVKIPYTNEITSSSLIKQGLSVVGEFSDGAIVFIESSQLTRLSKMNYTILDEVSPSKNYFFVYPMTKQIADQIRTSYPILASDKEYLLISAQPGEEDNLAKLPIMLARLDFTPLKLSEQAPVYPEVIFNPLVQQMVNNVSADSVLSFVRRLQNFRTRYSTTDSCRAAANWLKNKYLSYNCDSVYLHNYSSTYAPNVVAIKRGITYPDNIYLVICGHFDATSNQQPTIAPGADDNASGTAAALEAARVMKDFIFEYSIRYIAFSGEEQGLYGSAAYAQEARARGDSIIGVINYDMIAYSDIQPENLEVFGKTSNPNCSTFVNYFISSANTYTSLLTNRRMVSSMYGSDHHSFWQQGYVALLGIEDYSLVNPHYHLTSDTIGAGFNDLAFCTNVTKASVACLASLANPIYPNQSLVVYRYYRINDIIGNNNGRWDIGETTNLYITLKNIGQVTANNVSATITSTSPFVTIIQNSADYGNILSFDTAVNLTPFIVASSPNTQIGHNASFSLFVTSAETTWNYNFIIPIGAFVSTDPIPDGPRSPALYWAYDNTDTSYSQVPTYNWIEIKNIGTRLTFDQNDQVRKVPLPANFGFRFYGQRYDTISVSVDGFIRIGADTTRDYTNSSIPNPDGPSPMIAVNWDDLYHSNTGTYGGIWWYYNSVIGAFIVEWDSVYYYSANSVRDKFQVIIYDSTYSPPSGDNIIVFQYATANRYLSSTIGIEDPTETIGIQYLFDGSYHPAAATIQPGRAIKYTTQAPSGIFDYTAHPSLLATHYSLKVFPNPFRSQATIQLAGPIPIGKSVKIYNSSGRQIRSFPPVSSLLTPHYSFVWDGKDDFNNKVTQGIYFAKAIINNKSITTKIVKL